MDSNPIQILADVLPDMMHAVLAAPKASIPAEKALGGMTKAIAEYLNAEICSIFRINEKGNALVLTEAHGYEVSVIGEEYPVERGLTGKIYRDQLGLVLNYCVQDPSLGWAGRFDPKLQSHCWSLLAVPITSSQGTCHGVLKFENKRSEWATIKHGKFLTASIPVTQSHGEQKQICTPRMIAELVETVPNTEPRRPNLLFLAEQLSNEVHRISHLTRPPSNGASYSLAEHVDSLTGPYLAAKLSSTKAYAAALHHELDQLSSGSFNDLQLLRDLSEAFCLALDAYVPFSRDDFHLARALAQIIGMAFDASETARARALEMVRHGIKNVSSSFLGQIDLLYQRAHNLTDFKRIEPNIRFAYGTALDLTSSCEVASRSPRAGAGSNPNTVELTYSNGLLDRMLFYKNYTYCNGIDFEYPEPESLPVHIRHACISCDSGLIRGVLDGLIRNAVRHAHPKLIQFRITPSQKDLLLSVSDDGGGIGPERVRQIMESQSSMTFSNSGGFGLSAYRKALAEAGCSLELKSVLGKGTVVTISIPFSHSETTSTEETRKPQSQ